MTVDAKYTDDEAFKELYTTNADILHNWPAFENSDSFYDVLYKNIPIVSLSNALYYLNLFNALSSSLS